MYPLAFIAGFLGMALEIVAVRLVSPFLGSSTEVWAIIICVIMIALALGYFIGKHFRSIYLLFCLAGIYIIFSYYLITSFSEISKISFDLISALPNIRIFLISFVLFFIPIFLLGSIYPLLYRDTSSTVYAISTVGSVVGTLMATFVFIPLFGSKIAFLLIAVALELVALFGFDKWKKIFPLLVFAVIFFIFPRPKIVIDDSVIFQTESVYQPIRVIKQGDSYYLSLSNNSIENGYSSKYTPNKFLSNSYYDNFLLLPYFLPKLSPMNVLVVGLGGGTMTRQYQHYFSSISSLLMDGVEIDPEVVETGKKYLELEQKNLRIIVQDGRIFLSNSKDAYNLIFVDVYARQNYIPYHLATKEFLEISKKRLSEGGLIAYNVSDGSKQKKRLSYVSQTLKSVFPYVYSIYPNNGTEYLVIGSNTIIDFSRDLSKIILPELASIYEQFVKFDIKQIVDVDSKYVLNDDNAPDRI